MARETPTFGIRHLVCPKGESVTLFRLDTNAALASHESTIEAASQDVLAVGISLAPFASKLNKPIHCEGCIAGCRVELDFGEDAVLSSGVSEEPILSWKTNTARSNKVFETARLESVLESEGV